VLGQQGQVLVRKGRQSDPILQDLPLQGVGRGEEDERWWIPATGRAAGTDGSRGSR